MPSDLTTSTTPNLLEHATLGDLEAIRVLLRGSSVIDWHRLAFANHAEIDRFLRLNEFHWDDPGDKARLEALREEAVEYLVKNFGYRIPASVAQDLPVPDLFLLASSRGKEQTYACIVLKAMHVIHHLAGREILFTLPVSDVELFGLVEKKVVSVVETLRAMGHPIVEFAWSRKERDSIVTKLLAKRTNIAANVFDKLRFRMIVRDRSDLIGLLQELLHRLLPFNYVVPGESVNAIAPFRQIVEETPGFARHADRLQLDLDTEEVENGPLNEFSGPSYRIINFVADIPIRLDSILERMPHLMSDLGVVSFVLTEFQITDAETARANEAGENSHARYKQRQHERVKERLEHGADSATSQLISALPPPLEQAFDDGNTDDGNGES
jgi:uncharacterized protein (TIGR04552 family)